MIKNDKTKRRAFLWDRTYSHVPKIDEASVSSLHPKAYSGNRNEFIYLRVAKQRSPQSPLRSPATSSDVLLGDQGGALDATLLAQATRTQTGSDPARLPRKLSRQSCTLRDPEDASSRKRGLFSLPPSLHEWILLPYKIFTYTCVWTLHLHGALALKKNINDEHKH